MLLVNGNIITVDQSNPTAEALAFAEGRITGVGTQEEVLAAAGRDVVRVDLQGRTVIPGIVDNHSHPFSWGATLIGRRVNLTGATSAQEVVARIAAYAKSVPEGEWIQTTFMPRVALSDGRMPTCHDLDAASTRHPIYLTQAGKNAIVNSYALRLAEIDRDTPDPDGSAGEAEGRIVRDAAGEPTGHLIAGGGDVARARWWALLGQHPRLFEFGHLTPDECDRAAVMQMAQFNAAGVTSSRDMGATVEEIDSYVRVAEQGLATCRMDVMIGLPASFIAEEDIGRVLDECEEVRASHVDGWVRIAGIKVLLQNDGWWSLPPRKAEVLIKEANRRGWTLAFHVGSSVTDEVNAWLLDCLESANSDRPLTDRRFSWEHALGLFDPAAVDRITGLNVILACQPTLSHMAAARSAGMGAEMDALGMVKGPGLGLHGVARAIAEWGLPIRSWHDAGATVTVGTDWPASRTSSADPLANVAFAATQLSSIGVLQSEETVSVADALKMATLNGAYSMFAEAHTGSLEPGKFADFVLLATDPLAVPAEDVHTIEVLATVCNGRTVYRASNLDVEL